MSAEPIERASRERHDPDGKVIGIGVVAVVAVVGWAALGEDSFDGASSAALKWLQTARILVALPFVVVMLVLCFALLKELRWVSRVGSSRTGSWAAGRAGSRGTCSASRWSGVTTGPGSTSTRICG
ncbi:hypothetical protein ACFVZH_06820 [Streptomyces sp. NPDC059534]|uniref:hypothetical protein n=1 Tax=Streptomyces sp. NPDC059534 TaxID=3346859 RepID=UPI0036A7C791